MASRGSGISPPNENFLSRKKQEIIDRSMALFQQSLDRCLDNSVSAPVKRRAKRARDDDDVAPPEQRGHAVSEAVEAGRARNSKKKRVAQEAGGRKYACPFCKHDPARYKNVKTCCGPGWDDVHRVKEHVYRRHSLKNLCARCFEHFDKPEALKAHQRAKVPCELKQQSPDTITDEQEKQLRARAKPNWSEETKWQEMYRIIFPGEDVPSPYYDVDIQASSSAMRSRFKSTEECKEFLRAELPRLVRPAIEQYVNSLFEDFQEKVNKKTAEIIREVETQMLRTFQFGEEQSASSLPARVALEREREREPSPPLNSSSPGLLSSELAKVRQMFRGLDGDPFYTEFRNSLQYDVVEDLLAGTTNPGFGYGDCSVDSAYFTSSDGAFSAGSLALMPQYM